jgi:hypothetical protein
MKSLNCAEAIFTMKYSEKWILKLLTPIAKTSKNSL